MTTGKEKLSLEIINFIKNRSRIVDGYDRFREQKENLRTAVISDESLKFESLGAGAAAVDDEFDEIKEQQLLQSAVYQCKNRENATLTFVGQLKAGKSSAINQILRRNIVQQSPIPCTGRITRLSYGKDPIVRLRDLSGNIVTEKRLEKCTIPLEFTSPVKDEREKSNEIKLRIEGEFPLTDSLLETGIDLVDSPGSNENPELDRLVTDTLNGLLPIIIYVVHGRNGLNTKDIQDLRKIKNLCPEIKIFYVVTHLDSDTRPPKDEFELSQYTVDEKGQAEKKMLAVHYKLKQQGFLPADQSLEDCEDIFGISATAMQSLRKKKSFKSPQLDGFYSEMFDKFESHLYLFIERCLSAYISDIGKELQLLQVRLLNVLIEKANSVAGSYQQTVEGLKNIKEYEVDLFRKTNDNITKNEGTIVKKIKKRLKEIEKEIIDTVTTYAFEESSVEQCRQVLEDAIKVKIDTEIKELLNKEIFPNYTETLKSLMSKMEELDATYTQSTTFLAMKNMMVQTYRFNLNLQSTESQMTVKKHKNIRRRLRSWVQIPASSTPTTNVFSLQWKEEQAKKILGDLDKKKLGKTVCNDLHTFLDNAHINFMSALKEDENILTKPTKLTRESLQEKVQQVSLDFLETEFLLGDYTFPSYKLTEEDDLGRSVQGAVKKIELKDGQRMALKIITLPVNEFSVIRDYAKYGIALEKLFASQYHHPNILRLQALRQIEVPVKNLDEEELQIEYHLFYPLRQQNVQTFLRYEYDEGNNSSLPSLKRRLQIALEVAEGIKFLHNLNLIHRDIKLTNVVVDKDGANAALCDFGYTRSVGLHHFSRVGTPLHMAPEVEFQDTETIFDEYFYGTPADIYSFSIFLWCVAEGSGNPQHLAQSYVNRRPQKLCKLANRPQQFIPYLRKVDDLLEQAWQKDPNQRPTAREVCEYLETKLKGI